MIYTITLNPSLDRTVEVEELIYDDVNKIIEERKTAGGKGIDVSRMIKELGGQSIALGFAGGYNGLELEGRLIDEGVVSDFTRVCEEARTNIVFYQRKKKLQTLLSTAGPKLSSLEVSSLFNRIKEIPRGSFCVLSGSIPADMSTNFYAQIVTTLKEKGIRVLLDSDGDPMKNGVNVGPCVIKPNIHEFGRLVESNVSEIDEIVEHGRTLQDTVEYIVVSAGARGAVGISGNGSYYVVPPKVKVWSSAGAGDSFVAGLVYVMSQEGSFEEALKMAVACGTAATLAAGNKLGTQEDITKVKKEVIVKKI
jgi:6-phosphofructokinase 2